MLITICSQRSFFYRSPGHASFFYYSSFAFFLKCLMRFAFLSVMAGMFSCSCLSIVFLAPASVVVRCPLWLLESPCDAILVFPLPDCRCHSLRGFIGKWAGGSRAVLAADLVLVASLVGRCRLLHGTVFCLFELSRFSMFLVRILSFGRVSFAYSCRYSQIFF